jgi:2-dehydro-3-deoxyphosphogluconate aldolase/(4S)-4-hydroxy-2-oxoglutarate aldolase
VERPTVTYDRMTVLTAMQDQGVIPVFRHPDPQVCIQAIAACAAGGAPCIEFTNRGDFSLDIFAEVSRHFAKSNPAVILGVGSIVDAPTAALYIAHGARFVVGPLLNAEVARLCNRRMIPYSPGCATPTEIGQAQELGCEIVKLFPGGAAGGPAFVKDVLGPMPWSKIMPTGGIEPTEASLRPWFEAGIVACGMGSKLLPQDLLDKADWTGLEARVRQTVDLIRSIRGR